MTTIDIKIPKIGESITEAYIAQWLKSDGDFVENGEELVTLETDKISIDVTAEGSGTLKILIEDGETVEIGAVVGTIEVGQGVNAPSQDPSQSTKAPTPQVQQKPQPAAPPVESQPTPQKTPELERPENPKVERTAAKAVQSGGTPSSFMAQQILSNVSAPLADPKEEQWRERMSPIRQRIAERLLQAKNNTAMLTTFNEIDMTRVKQLRKEFKEPFMKKYGINLGMMSFFIKATIEALKECPRLNAKIDGNDVVFNRGYHIGVAIGGGKGLTVPVIRNAQNLNMAQIEATIKTYVDKIQANKLELSDLEGGTFTISNGGVYGSLLSTPILNMPQTGILGMHKIEDRPVAINGKVEIRPMMYVALSYDHRIIDGRESVTFLKKIKECIEEPSRMVMGI